MSQPRPESLQRLLAFVECRLDDLATIEGGGSIRVDRERLAEATRLGFMKRAEVGGDGKSGMTGFLDVEFHDKLPALALLLAYCVARDARLADQVKRDTQDTSPRIEVPTSPPRKAASARPKVQPRCA